MSSPTSKAIAAKKGNNITGKSPPQSALKAGRIKVQTPLSKPGGKKDTRSKFYFEAVATERNCWFFSHSVQQR